MHHGAAWRALAAAPFLAACAAAAASANPRATYLVALSNPPLAAHAAAVAHVPGASAQQEKRALRGAMKSADADAYLRQLDAARTRVLTLAAQTLGRALTPQQVFRHAADGMALMLNADEARRIAGLPGVAAVRRERILHLHTDAGPQWIGANQLWTGQVAGIAATKGEGIVIGMVDSGINPVHPAFAATGGDGYTVSNARGHFYGLCASSQAQCNAKLIGIYDFTTEGTQGVDSTGHGSHTSGIAAGNVEANALHGHTVSLSRNVSGVAPHANLIMYKGCNAQPIDSSSSGTCAESALVGALDQATADQVDVINYSIGGDGFDPYELLADPTTDTYAMFQARAAGIVVAVSAGNEGPGRGTLDEPGNSPWVLTAANASHNRRFVNSIGSFSGAANAPATLSGQGYTAGFGPAAIVYAGNYGNALCGVGTSEGVTPTGASNPFAAGTFHGEIVICDRGTYARVEKGYNVKAAGAGGYILANAPSDGESIVSDDHFLPAVHLGYAEGQTLKTWVATSGSHSGTIAGVSAVLDASFGDVLDASSSRGPFGFGGGVLKPDLTAPGDNILSAAQTGSGLALLSGTSMASPHIAGAAALVLAAHPDWTPAQVESTLLGTALADVKLEDGTTAASPLDAGAGRVQPAAAVQAGLYLPLSNSDFFAGSGNLSNPTAHGDLSKLNRASIESEDCFQHCTFTRTVTDISGGGTWQASATATTGVVVTTAPSQFTLAAGASQTLTITVDVTDPRVPGNWVSGRLSLHKTSGGRSATDIGLAIAVFASPGTPPAFQQLDVDASGGNKPVDLSGLVALPQASFAATSLAPAAQNALTLGVDPNSNDLYGTFPGPGKQFILIPNVYNLGIDTASIGRVFIVEVASSSAPVTNLYAGIDSNGDGLPTQSEQGCFSSMTSSTASAARCVIDLRGAGAVNVWALVDVPQGVAGSNYSVTLSSGIPSFNLVEPHGAVGQRLHVTGPGHVGAGAAFALRLFWDRDELDEQGSPLAPGTYYGAVTIDGVRGLGPSALGQSGVVPLSIVRGAGNEDVADALIADVPRGFELAGPTSLQHVFIDVPAGTTTLEIDSNLTGAVDASVSFSAIRADFPASSSSFAIPAAPQGPPDATWNLDATHQTSNTMVAATPGRWYIVVRYNGSKAASVNLVAKLTHGGAPAPSLTPGNYFNPQRGGHGIFVSQASGQQVIDWYTYLEDGTPTWYLAQNLAPAAGTGMWTSTLYRATWDGSGGTPTPVGDVTMTAIAQDQATYSWHLYGQAGSETFQLLAAPACVNAGGNVNLNGEWYPPAQGGYGFDALVLPSQQFDAFYLYDASGNPVWVVGGNGPFAASSSVPMLQSTGFCPLCTYQAITTQPAGSLTVSYANGSNGQLTTAITLNSPLAGTWNVSQPIGRLTGSVGCP